MTQKEPQDLAQTSPSEVQSNGKEPLSSDELEVLLEEDFDYDFDDDFTDEPEEEEPDDDFIWQPATEQSCGEDLNKANDR